MSATKSNAVNSAYADLPSGRDAVSSLATGGGVPANNNENGSLDLSGKIENFKVWSSTAMKCTKQAIEEKLGTTSLTRDPDIEAQVEGIKRMQAKYLEISASVKKMIVHLKAVTTLEQSLSLQLTTAAQHQPELNAEFAHNAETQRVVAASTGSYVDSLGLFCDGLDTFCKKAVPDTLATIRHLENARLVYDTYRNDLERMRNKEAAAATEQLSGGGGERGGGGGDVTSPASTDPTALRPSSTLTPTSTQRRELSAQQLRHKFIAAQQTYSALRADTDVKMKLLHENRARVIRKHLQALQVATLSYYANGYRDLELSLKALSERETPSSLCSKNQPLPSFLEIESPSTNPKPVYFSRENDDTEQRDVFQE